MNGAPGMPTPAAMRPRALREGDLIGLFNPSGAVYERAPYEQTRRALQALGLRKTNDVRELKDSPSVRGLINQVGYLVRVEE